MSVSTPIAASPKAFISYSWDDDAHSQWVKDFATRLRGDGVDVTLDRWHAVPGDQLPAFMETTHVISNDKTARNYVARLEAMGVKLDQATAEMQRQAHLGVILPPSLLERSLTVIQDTVAASGTASMVSCFAWTGR